MLPTTRNNEVSMYKALIIGVKEKFSWEKLLPIREKSTHVDLNACSKLMIVKNEC